MREMELFVDMIDEEEANRILRFFQESVPGVRKNSASLNQKKQHIKNIFKSLTPLMRKKRRSGGPEPFYTYINHYKFPELTKGNYKEQFIFLEELGEKISPFLRFAYLLLNYPNELREDLDRVAENLEKGIDPLQLDYELKTNEEVRMFFRKHRSYAGSDRVQNLINDLEIYQDQNSLKLIEECKKEIKGYGLLEYYNEYDKFKKKFGNIVSNIAYVLTHLDKENEEDGENEDILLSLAIEAAVLLLDINNNELEEDLHNEIKDLKDSLANINKTYEVNISKKNKEIESVNEKINLLEKAYEELNQEKKALNQELKVTQGQNSELKQQLANLEAKHEKKLAVLQEEHDKKLKQVQNHYEKKFEKAQGEFNKKLQLEKENLERLQTTEATKKENWLLDKNFSANWAVITTSTSTFLEEIYPEVMIGSTYTEDSWKRIIDNKNITNIYLQMNGLSTRQFKRIRSYINQKEKNYHTFEIENTKQLLDLIGFLKMGEREKILK
ncbi:hypothetical protein [Priestia megaterium]|uniref:Uncharacterized protein n=1 Tax=Priestia megaterium TaxID=1404 RepID=A0A6M6E7C0_PRIMG|nr:hypothetical protein [Priestia megaterium]QJX81376.1 hypothetical protein FDZ14_35325 [Priestia megaterium]